MNLIIVESPTKARTIKNFLGKEKGEYEVIASKGHIRDLPKKRFGIKIEAKNFIPEYEISSEHKKIVDEIKELAKKAENIYIATDGDREGEAIGYHITKALNLKNHKYPRIVFHEITKKAILDSIKHPRDINMDMVNAQQARRLLDRIVGFKLSPLLNQKIQNGLSAGRVQSSALKIIIDRENEIKNFKSIDYYSINAIFNGIKADLIEWEGYKLDRLSLQNKEEALKMQALIKEEKFKISNIEIKKKSTPPPPPFMTSTLQQSASSKLGFSPSKTMKLAQKLYEGVNTNNGVMGVITYMRTDSLNISKVALDFGRKFILEEYGEKYLPKSIRIYKTKNKSAQEAHEAIRPTKIQFTPEIAEKFLESDELKLYSLIYRRFLASLSSDAIFENKNIFFSGKQCVFKASGSELCFDGFYKILGGEKEDTLLPKIDSNEEINLEKCDLNSHVTEPPPRYSEASLIKVLEGFGIGRPSTYAPTISLLLDREYIKIEKKQIHVRDIAFKVMDVLENHFIEIVDSKFSANLEDKLDDIALCKIDWQSVLWDFYEPFLRKINDGKTNIQSLKIAIPTGESCPECGNELIEKMGRFGKFISCKAYPKCKYVKKETKEEKEEGICDKCGEAMVRKVGKRGEFLACKAYPKCKNTKSLAPTLNIKCPKCNGDLVQRYSKRGNFFGCSSYPKCDFISKTEPIKLCEECGYLMVKKTTKKEEFLECMQCKHRENEENIS